MKLVGTTFSQTFASLSSRVKAGPRNVPLLKRWEAITRIVISFCVLGLGAYLMFSTNDAQQKFGAGFIGVVTGYWLR